MNPENRSKIGQLQESMEETKAVLMDNLDSTLKRGQLIEQSVDKSQQLVDTSYTFKKKSKEVKVSMCCRKWMYYIIGVVAGLIILVLLYFILR